MPILYASHDTRSCCCYGKKGMRGNPMEDENKKRPCHAVCPDPPTIYQHEKENRREFVKWKRRETMI